MNWDAINEIIQRHGGAVSPPVLVDPLIDNPDPVDRRLNPKIENPNPTYRYNLKDGKYFTAKANQAGQGTGQGTDEAIFQIVDPGNAVQPLTPADRLPSAAQDLVKLDAGGSVIDAQGNITLPDGTKKPATAAKLRDPSTGLVTDLPDPKTSPDGTVKEFGNQLLNIKPDGTYSVIASKTDQATAQAKSTFDGPDGARYEYDPNADAGKRLTKLIEAPPDKTAPTTKVVNGQTYQWDPSTKAWTGAAGLPSEKKAVAVYGTGANDKFRISLDDQGNVVSREPNPNFVQPTPTQLQADLVAPNIPLLKPDGTVQWVPNQNRVPANQAMYDLMDQLHIKVNDRSMSMADAKDLLTGSVNTLNAQTAATNAATAQQQNATTAAGDILANTRGNAQTGAGLIQQRVQAASGMLNNILGLAGQGQRSGNMGGGLMNAPAGLGEALVGGIQGWTADLSGGQQTLDSAARMVQMADPSSNVHDPATQHAIGVLSQMLDKYQDLNGVPHPAVTATQAAQQSQQNGGMTAPVTQPVMPAAPAPIQMPAMAAGFQAPPAQIAGQNYGAATGYTGGVPPSSYGYTPPGASYSYPGPSPWVAPPGPSFVAPSMPVPLAPVTVR